MKVLPLPCKWLDLRVARMTMYNGGLVSNKKRKNLIVSPISAFELNTLTIKNSGLCVRQFRVWTLIF